MRAGIDNTISCQTMWEIDVCAGIAEAKLQNSHSWDFVIFAQGIDVGSDVAQILGEKRKTSKLFPQLVEKFVSRTVDPAASDRGFFLRRDFPELSEATKVIKADEVAGLGRPAQTFNPPRIACRPHC